MTRSSRNLADLSHKSGSRSAGGGGILDQSLFAHNLEDGNRFDYCWDVTVVVGVDDDVAVAARYLVVVAGDGTVDECSLVHGDHRHRYSGLMSDTQRAPSNRRRIF